MAAAIKTFIGEADVREGRVALDIPPLVENGNSVPLKVTVDSPMTPQDFVKTIAVFNERNPQPNVAYFHLSPRAGRATVSTRIRLGDSQNIVAIAQLSDGTFWSGTAELVVTLPACVEG
jgi:sulfur-oxidizing protein SoxY